MAKRKSKRAVRSDKVNFNVKQRAQLESLAGVGLTVEQIAEYFFVSKATLERRIAEDPALKEALMRGRTRAHAQVARAAYEMAVDKKHSDFTKFYLRSRYGWSEKQDIHISTTTPEDAEKGFIDQIKNMTTEELADFVAQGRKQGGE